MVQILADPRKSVWRSVETEGVAKPAAYSVWRDVSSVTQGINRSGLRTERVSVRSAAEERYRQGLPVGRPRKLGRDEFESVVCSQTNLSQSFTPAYPPTR